MTTMPAIDVVSSIRRMPSTAAWSAEILSPRPIQRPAAIAADSVTRTSSSATLRSGALAGTVETGLSTLSVTLQSLHARGSLASDQLEAERDHDLRRTDEAEPELLRLAVEHPVLVVEAVEVVRDADRVGRERVRPAPLDGLLDDPGKLGQPLDELLLLGSQPLRT